MELEGKIIVVGNTRGGVSTRGNQWKVQEYVLETMEQYPRKMAFEVFGEDRIQQFNIQLGQMKRVSFDIDARQWNDRWYNSIRAWKVEDITAPSAQPAPAAQGAPASASVPPFSPAAPIAPADFAQTDSAEDLPF